jgi:uncharacterized protein YuzE
MQIQARVPLVCTYDSDADAAYIYFDHPIPAGAAKQVVPFDSEHGMLNVDLNAAGHVLGLEIVGARKHLPPALLRAILADENQAERTDDRPAARVTDQPDPTEIIARVPEEHGKQRAFDVWCHKAREEGWSVTVESTSTDQPGDACGVVDIEGLKYRIHHAKRVRLPVGIVPPERHLVAAALDLSHGDSDGITWTSRFDHAAWAEPIVGDQ